MTTITAEKTITATLTADEANALVEAIGWGIVQHAEGIEHGTFNPTVPGSLHQLSLDARRIGRLEALGRQLDWRTWHKEPQTATLTDELIVDLIKHLQYWATSGAEEGEGEPFEQAAKSLARQYANAGMGS